MNKRSKTLGIIGSCLNFILAVIVGLLGIIVIFISAFQSQVPEVVTKDITSITLAIIFSLLVLLLISSGILSIIGAVNKSNNIKTSTTLMIVGATLSLISIVGFLPGILMMLGGIFAKTKKVD